VSAAPTGGAIRGSGERLLQSLWFEAIGVVIASPLVAHFTDASAGTSMTVLLALSIATMAWSALYNTAFDLIEWRCTRRVASSRPQGLRLVHALAHEASAAVVTWPLIVTLTPLDWEEALIADLGLTLFYAVYGYVFHLGFDRLRPVRTPAAARRGVNVLGGGLALDRS
jgi:uncharacterized membrane protein